MSVSLGSAGKATLEGVKHQLKAPVDLEGNNVKSDLYSHLTEVFNRILQYHPYDAYDKFEEISNMVKQTNLKFVDPKYDFEINNQNKKITNEEALAYIRKIKSLIEEETKGVEKSLLTKD